MRDSFSLLATLLPPILCGIFGLFTCGELTSPGVSQYGPTIHLSFNDLAMVHRSASSLIQITKKESKTDPFNKGI